MINQLARAFVELDWKADTEKLHQLIDSIRSKNPGALPSIADTWLLCALMERDTVTAENALNADVVKRLEDGVVDRRVGVVDHVVENGRAARAK